jgi:hypothetical protein
MTLHLRDLPARHPKLSKATASTHLQRAALGLQRRHRPGVSLAIRIEREDALEELAWEEYPLDDVEQIDRHRITEDGADAIALSVVHERFGWTVLRRLQRDDFADWLLVHTATRHTIALEVSGTDDGDANARMREKIDQMQRCSLPVHQRAACIVRYADPRCTLVFLPEMLR